MVFSRESEGVLGTDAGKEQGQSVAALANTLFPDH